MYKEGDPVEYLIPFNEFIYHLTETRQKVDIIYWLNWIIEYDILCRKKRKIIGCVSRDIYQNSRKNIGNKYHLDHMGYAIYNYSKENIHQI